MIRTFCKTIEATFYPSSNPWKKLLEVDNILIQKLIQWLCFKDSQPIISNRYSFLISYLTEFPQRASNKHFHPMCEPCLRILVSVNIPSMSFTWCNQQDISSSRCSRYYVGATYLCISICISFLYNNRLDNCSGAYLHIFSLHENNYIEIKMQKSHILQVTFYYTQLCLWIN